MPTNALVFGVGKIIDFSGTELPQSHREQSSVNRDLALDSPVQAKKRQLDVISESGPRLAKRARLTRTDVGLLGVVDEKAEQTDKV